MQSAPRTLFLRSGARWCLSLLSVTSALSAQPSVPVKSPTPLQAVIERAAAALPAGGMVFAEIRNGKVTFGSAGQPGVTPGLAPENIVFEIGSISKVFTALLLAQAVEEGRAKLDDPIRRFLPESVTLSNAAAALTLEQLATHTSGLPSLPDNFRPVDPLDPYADYTVDQLYNYLGRYQPEKPGPQPASYSNVGFGLLGHVLERILGSSYTDLVATRITGPLGMWDTAITLTAEQTTRFAKPHSSGETVRPWRLPTLPGAGALRSTASDMTRFAQGLLSKENNPLSKAWTLIAQPRASFGSTTTQIGLAVLIAKRDGRTLYHHSGGTGGFRSYLELDPEADSATVLLLNNDSPEPAAVVAASHRPPQAAGQAARATRPENPLEPARLVDYPGVYAMDARARFTVVLDAKGRLQARLTGQPFIPIYHHGSDRFFVRVVEAEYQFNRDAGGRIDSLTLHQNGNEIVAARVAGEVPVVRFLPSEQLADYVGRYQLTPTLVFEVTTRAQHLFVKLTGQPSLPVFNDAEDHFVYDVVPAALTFERDATSGRVTAVVLHQNGRDRRAARLEAAGAP